MKIPIIDIIASEHQTRPPGTAQVDTTIQDIPRLTEAPLPPTALTLVAIITTGTIRVNTIGTQNNRPSMDIRPIRLDMSADIQAVFPKDTPTTHVTKADFTDEATDAFEDAPNLSSKSDII